MARISKRTVDAARAQTGDSYVWDRELSGFGLKVTPAGRKVYLVQYRVGGRKGRTRRVTVGPHGTLTADEARVEAKRLLGQVAAGLDPAAVRQEGKGRPALGTLLDQFLVDHAEAKLKASTAGEYRRLARLYVPATLRRKVVAEVLRSDVARLHLAMKDKPYQANRTLALLSKFFNWCEKHGNRSDGSNPCRHVGKFRERRHERFLSAQELARLGAGVVDAEQRGTASPFAIGAIRLLAFTGARLSEILTLRWAHVDFDNACLRLPVSKTGQKSIYLNAPALAVLRSLPRLEGNPWVIPGEHVGAHLVNLQKPWRRIRKVADLEDVRIHDLRHSFASVAAASGQSLYVIGSLLGHSQPQTTSRYAHLSADPLRAANDAVGDRIDNTMRSPAIVTPLGR
ncbi:MAG TPA: site-specific integrase [Bauldia sp.]